MHYAELHPGLYFQPGKWHFKEKSGLLILNNTGEKIDNFIQAVKNQNILVDVISGNNISDQLVHNGAIQVDIEDKKYGFTLMCHVEKTNCFPVLVNIISNAFLNMLNSTAHLRIWSQVFLGEFQNEHLPSYFLELQMLQAFIFLPALPPQFAMMSMNDYKIKTHSQLWISGLFPSAYWFGQALIDVPLHCALLVLGLWPWILKLTIATTGNLSILCLLLVLSYFYMPDDEIYNLYMKKIWMSALMVGLLIAFLVGVNIYPLVLSHFRLVVSLIPRISPQRKRSHQNLEELSEENDRDVLDERRRAQSALTSANEEEIQADLTFENKETAPKINRCVGSKGTVSVSVPGEILGLLGPNGAGKSTTISMIMGDVDPTAGQYILTLDKNKGGPYATYLGQVWIKGADGAATEENAVLGCCPQENVLWSSLTMKEHLEIFAALCFALSMLSNPTLWLLDEPTTGLDPKGKHQVWRAIHTMLENNDEGAILTTHHMEEAETVCDRVAIMVAGQLRCLGSIQYLKSKFGKNYLLQIKVKGEEQGDLVNTQILKMFPQAARQERISTLLVYKIPMKDALPLSKAFSMLEKAKQFFSLEEYSFSLNTLEQVFLELCKDQERDYVDLALNTTFDWKKLQEADL
ncbi:hypothetical protein Chor_012265 [Crotalus horridus]